MIAIDVTKLKKKKEALFLSASQNQKVHNTITM
jgi:hypothetical protein